MHVTARDDWHKRVMCVVWVEQREWFRETEGAATPLWSWLRALATKERFARKGRWWEIRCVVSGVVFLSGQNHQNCNHTQGFHSSRTCRGGDTYLFHLCFARRLGSLLSNLSITHGTRLSAMLTVSHSSCLSRTVHPIPTLPQQPPAFQFQCTDTYHRTDPFFC